MDAPTESGAVSAGGKERFRVYVANIPPRVTRDELQQEFSRVGAVIDVLVPKNGKYAFIDYRTQDEANLAITSMNQHVLNGHSLRVEMGKGEPRLTSDGKLARKTARTQNRVVVLGLSASSSWQDLKDIMRETGGEVTFTSIQNGVGYAEFALESDVDRAVEKLDGQEVRGTKLSVKRDEVTDRDLERDQPPGRRDRKRRGDDRRRRRSRTPPRRRDRSQRARRRSRGRRSPDDSRRRRDKDDKDNRRDKDEKDRDRDGRRDKDDKERERDSGRRRRGSESSRSRSPRGRRNRGRSA